MDDDAIIQTKVLDHNDRQSPTWGKLRKHLEARLQELRVRNDSDSDAVSTANTRGAIREVKNLLALDEPAPAIEADEDS